MDRIEEAVSALRNTSIYDEMLTVWNYYKSIENDFSQFEEAFSIRCPDRCGQCCERFIPDVTYLEGLLIAFYISFVEKRDISYLAGWSESHTGCPLFNNDTKRCTVYSVRPVICRVFCSAASETKDGLSFRGCFNMERNLDDRTLKEKEIHIPVMSEYGEKIRSLQEWDTETMLLDEAIISITSKLMLIRSFIDENGDDFTPQAS